MQVNLTRIFVLGMALMTMLELLLISVPMQLVAFIVPFNQKVISKLKLTSIVMTHLPTMENMGKFYVISFCVIIMIKISHLLLFVSLYCCFLNVVVSPIGMCHTLLICLLFFIINLDATQALQIGMYQV